MSYWDAICLFLLNILNVTKRLLLIFFFCIFLISMGFSLKRKNLQYHPKYCFYIVNAFNVKLFLFEHCKNLLTCAVKSISEGPDPARHRGLKIAKTCMAVHWNQFPKVQPWRKAGVHLFLGACFSIRVIEKTQMTIFCSEPLTLKFWIRRVFVV